MMLVLAIQENVQVYLIEIKLYTNNGLIYGNLFNQLFHSVIFDKHFELVVFKS